MGEQSKIEWTHHTYNPWWGCARVSPGCEHCYAEAFAKRTGHKVWGAAGERRFFGDKHWAEPFKWNAAACKANERRRVFCASMADVFEDRRDLDEHRDRLWPIIDCTPWLDWLLLTKRPQNIAAMLPPGFLTYPRPNVWLGTTVEDQKRADERIPHLLKVPAAVRFLSAEPLLERVNLHAALCEHANPERPEHRFGHYCDTRRDGIHWVIVGGESGGGSRPFDVAWARDLVGQCAAAGAACFVKQLGAKPTSAADNISHRGNRLPLADGFYRYLNDSKGGDWAEWPTDLQVREFPEVRA